jgi:ankyrin repeat protein
VNAHGYSGPTALTEAVDDGLTDYVKLLLEAGADPNIPNQVTIALLISLC